MKVTVGTKHDSMWVGLTDDEMVYVEHLAELLHRQINLHGSIGEGRSFRALVTYSAVCILHLQSICLKYTW